MCSQQSGPRWQSRKILHSPHPMNNTPHPMNMPHPVSTPKLPLHRVTHLRMTWGPAEQVPYDKGYKDKHTETGQRDRDRRVRTHTLHAATCKQEGISQILEAVPKERGVRAHTGAPQPGGPAHLTLTPSVAYIWESHGTLGNQDSALEGLVHRLASSESWCRGSGWKNTWSYVKESHWLTSGQVPRGRDLLELSSGTKVLVDTIF